MLLSTKWSRIYSYGTYGVIGRYDAAVWCRPATTKLTLFSVAYRAYRFLKCAMATPFPYYQILLFTIYCLQYRHLSLFRLLSTFINSSQVWKYLYFPIELIAFCQFCANMHLWYGGSTYCQRSACAG